MNGLNESFIKPLLGNRFGVEHDDDEVDEDKDEDGDESNFSILKIVDPFVIGLSVTDVLLTSISTDDTDDLIGDNDG